MSEYDRLYVAFLYYFNDQRDYFECHEVMEELWLEEGRNPLYQGLLQIAVGLYHHLNGNPSGSIKLFSAGLDKLTPYPAHTLGIDLGLLVKDSEVYLEKLMNMKEEPFLPYDLDIRILDQELEDLLEDLKLDPPVGSEHE
jgi:predicted metal-dependent hydrolase